MNTIIIPAESAESVIYCLRDRLKTENEITFNYSDYCSYGTYSYILWEAYYPTIEQAEKWISEAYPEYYLYKENDCLIFYKSSPIISIGTYGVSPIWSSGYMDTLNKTISLLEPENVIGIEVSTSVAQINRCYPSILIANKYGWESSGGPRISNQIKPLTYKNVANLVQIPNCFAPEGIYDVQDYPDRAIITPWCFILDNSKYYGYGNTVMINSAYFSPATTENMPSIYDLLTEKEFWESVLFPLATRPFSELREELVDQELPFSLQVRMFKYQANANLLNELENLRASKASSQEAINYKIQEITNLKIQMQSIDDTIATKIQELGKKTSVKELLNTLKRLKRLPYLEKFEFLSDGIVFYTKPIQIDDGPFLGGYKIKYNNSNKHIKIENLVNPERGGELAHPHIPQNGTPCFGNYTDIYYNFETGDYYVGLELLHEFLSTYNPDDEWGRRLIHWDAHYVFEDMKNRGITHKIESCWNNRWYEIYGEYLNREDTCPECGEYYADCECGRCRFCNELYDDCECDICYNCGELVEDGCICQRCEYCGSLIDDCECERCENCDGLMEQGYDTSCECERCLIDDSILDENDERCLDCYRADCVHNQNPPATQEETLFDEEGI